MYKKSVSDKHKSAQMAYCFDVSQLADAKIPVIDALPSVHIHALLVHLAQILLVAGVVRHALLNVSWNAIVWKVYKPRFLNS